jgi:hypothetical protein
MATRVWNEGAPGSGDNVGEGDDRIRDDKFDTRERLQQGGHVVSSGGPYTPSGATANNDGKHAVANGGDHPTGFKVYKSDQTTTQCDFSDTAITAGTGVSIVGGNITSGAEPGHTHRGTIAIWLPGSISPGRARAVFRAPKALTFEQLHIHVITRHTGGGNLRLNVGLLSPVADGTDRFGAAATAIQAVGDRPVLLPSGNYHDDGNSVFTTASMNADDELVFDIENTGAAWGTSPQDILIHVDVLG